MNDDNISIEICTHVAESLCKAKRAAPIISFYFVERRRAGNSYPTRSVENLKNIRGFPICFYMTNKVAPKPGKRDFDISMNSKYDLEFLF